MEIHESTETRSNFALISRQNYTMYECRCTIALDYDFSIGRGHVVLFLDSRHIVIAHHRIDELNCDTSLDRWLIYSNISHRYFDYLIQ